MMLKSRPTGMTFKAYKAMCKAGGAEAMDEGAFNKLPEKDEDDEGGEGENAEKALADVNDLQKAIDAYDDVEKAMDGTGGSRESYLTARVQNGTISKSERSELADIWAKGTTPGNRGTDVRKSLDAQIEDGENGADARKLMDASPFLKSLVDSVDASLDSMRAGVVEDGRQTRQLLKAQGTIIKAQAGVIGQQQAVIGALAKRLGVVERTPVVRKSAGADPRDTRPRDLGNPGGGGDQPNALRKSDVNRALSDLVKSADAAGDRPAVDKLVEATALYEGTGRMKPNIEAAVRAHLAG